MTTTFKAGDRVRHHSGVTGTVVSVSQQYIGDTELYNFSQPVYVDVVMVREDKLPRQRKEYPIARWDGIEAV